MSVSAFILQLDNKYSYNSLDISNIALSIINGSTNFTDNALKLELDTTKQ